MAPTPMAMWRFGVRFGTLATGHRGFPDDLTINVPDEQEPALKARAQVQGLSPEEFVGQVQANELEASASKQIRKAFTRQAHSSPDEEEPVRDPKRPIWEAIAERMHALAPDVFERLPEDGASQHDHHIYGLPKREQ